MRSCDLEALKSQIVNLEEASPHQNFDRLLVQFVSKLVSSEAKTSIISRCAKNNSTNTPLFDSVLIITAVLLFRLRFPKTKLILFDFFPLNYKLFGTH